MLAPMSLSPLEKGSSSVRILCYKILITRLIEPICPYGLTIGMGKADFKIFSVNVNRNNLECKGVMTKGV